VRVPLLLALALLLGLAACGKRGSPEPPGPPDQVTYPRIYPTH
jgi:predicted small lipoprotein YifL